MANIRRKNAALQVTVVRPCDHYMDSLQDFQFEVKAAPRQYYPAPLTADDRFCPDYVSPSIVIQQEEGGGEEKVKEFCYNTHSKRFATFEGWPFSPSAYRLAKSGFFYTGTADQVECFCCGLRIKNLHNTLNILELHKDLTGNGIGYDCAFINSICAPTHDVYDMDMQRMDERLKTFEDWPARQFGDKPTVTPQSLAAAGFFYTGRMDSVRCCSCGNLVRFWEKGDDPLVEHLKILEECKKKTRCQFVEKNFRA